MLQTLHSGWLPTHSLHRPIRMQHLVSAYSCTYWFRKSIRKDFSCYCCCSQTPPFLVHTLKVCLTINELLIGSSTHTQSLTQQLPKKSAPTPTSPHISFFNELLLESVFLSFTSSFSLFFVAWLTEKQQTSPLLINNYIYVYTAFTSV